MDPGSAPRVGEMPPPQLPPHTCPEAPACCSLPGASSPWGHLSRSPGSVKPRFTHPAPMHKPSASPSQPAGLLTPMALGAGVGLSKLAEMLIKTSTCSINLPTAALQRRLDTSAACESNPAPVQARGHHEQPPAGPWGGAPGSPELPWKVGPNKRKSAAEQSGGSSCAARRTRMDQREAGPTAALGPL